MKDKKLNSKIEFGIQFAPDIIISKNSDLTRDIIINVIQIDPSDVLLTDESDLLNLVKLEDIISRTEEIYGITLTEEQVLNLRMKDYIALILSHKQ
jgi:hypothetical protein